MTQGHPIAIPSHPVLDRAFLHGYRGSIAHGTYVPGDDPDSIDDKDTMAFYAPPLDHYFGLSEFGSRGTLEIKDDPWDIVVYEARKALRLLSQGNPNVLSMLWLPHDLYVRISAGGHHLLAYRHLFVGRHVYRPFVGYAAQQLEKMQKGAYRGYMGERRKALVERHGYDTKNATHLIRLLRQGIEFLRDGEMTVRRADAEELLAIKRGAWSLERVHREAARLFEEARATYESSRLPARPDRDAINRLCVEIVQMELFHGS